jgi:hypothetical protein
MGNNTPQHQLATKKTYWKTSHYRILWVKSSPNNVHFSEKIYERFAGNGFLRVKYFVRGIAWPSVLDNLPLGFRPPTAAAR